MGIGEHAEDACRSDVRERAKDAEIAALRAQLAAAEERERRLRAVFPRILSALKNGSSCTPDVSVEFIEQIPAEVSAALASALAAARADAVREFAEYLKKLNRFIPTYELNDHVLRFHASSFGVPSARPDDGRVERAARKWSEIDADHGWANFDELPKHQRDELMKCARAVLAAADAAERGGR